MFVKIWVLIESRDCAEDLGWAVRGRGQAFTSRFFTVSVSGSQVECKRRGG